MQPPTIDIEQIVRVVMQRLAAGRDLMEGVAEMVQPAAESTELAIRDRVVTTHLVEDRLNDKRTLRVGSRAIVTPAVLDLLRAKKIQLVRDSQPRLSEHPSAGAGAVPAAVHSGIASPATAVPPVLVCGSAVWFNSLARHLSSQQARVHACNDDAAVQLIEHSLSSGSGRAVWLTSRPFAAVATVQRTSKVVAVQLGSLADLSAALEQAQPQLLIVDTPRWTVAAIGNLVRALARSH